MGYGLFDRQACLKSCNARFATVCGAKGAGVAVRDLPIAHAAELDRSVRSVAQSGRAVLGLHLAPTGRGDGLWANCRFDIYPAEEGAGRVLVLLSCGSDDRAESIDTYGRAVSEASLLSCILSCDGTVLDVRWPQALAAGDPVLAPRVGEPIWAAPCWSYDTVLQLRMKEAVMRAAVSAPRAAAEIFEADVQVAPCKIVPSECRVFAEGRESGAPEALVLFAQDISARRKEEARQSLLIAELDHRIKNILSVIQAMIGQTARFARSPDDLVTGLQGRVHTMAEVHALLMRSRAGVVNLRDLVTREIRSIVADPAICEIDGTDMALPGRVATSMSLIIHELATNAAKYGALAGPGGHLRIVWRVGVLDGEPALILTWCESAPEPIAPPRHTGFGTHLIGQTIRHELSGRVEFSYPQSGLECAVSLPLSRLQEGAPA